MSASFFLKILNISAENNFSKIDLSKRINSKYNKLGLNITVPVHFNISDRTINLLLPLLPKLQTMLNFAFDNIHETATSRNTENQKK